MKLSMKKMMKRTAIIGTGLAILITTGCSPLVGGLGLSSLVSFGAGYLVGSLNTQPQVTREYYIDGVKVEDPAALGLE
jgi:hypothetical protein